MSEQKFAEFRERAEHVVTPANPDRLLKRGRALRRRRHVTPVVAVAAIAALGYGILTAGGDDGARTDDLPPVAPPSTPATPAPRWLEEDLPVAPGVYDLEIVMDDVPDATFEVFGDGWDAFSGGIYKADTVSAVSMGLGLYSDIPIDRCDPDRRAESLAGAVRQLSRIPGTVIAGPIAEPVTGVTHLRLSLPVDVECPDGAIPLPCQPPGDLERFDRSHGDRRRVAHRARGPTAHAHQGRARPPVQSHPGGAEPDREQPQPPASRRDHHIGAGLGRKRSLRPIGLRVRTCRDPAPACR